MSKPSGAFWRTLLCFSLPFIILSHVIEYLLFGPNRLSVPHPVIVSVLIDVIVLFAITGLFHSQANKRKKEQGE